MVRDGTRARQKLRLSDVRSVPEGRHAIGGTCRPNPATLLIADDGAYRTYRSIYPDHAGTRL